MHKLQLLRSKISRLPPHWPVAASAWLCRIIVILTRILTIPLLLGYLGVDQYAVFATIVSLEGWFLLTDFGVGSSFQNYLSEARAKSEETKVLLSSVAQLAFFFLAIVLLLLALMSQQVENYLFSDLQLGMDRGKAFLVAGLLYVFAAIGAIGYRALYAYQKGYWVHASQALASLFGLLILCLLVKYYEGNHKLLYSLAGMLAFSALFASYVFIRIFNLKQLFAAFCWSQIQKIGRRSFDFWIFGLMAASVLLVDYLIMAKTLNARDIVVYNILSKIFAAIYFVYYAVLQALWPSLAEMLNTQRIQEVGTTIKKYALSGIFFILLATLFLLFFSEWVIELFSPRQGLHFSYWTLWIFAVYYSMRIVTDTYAIALMSMSKLNILFVLVPIQAIIGGAGQYYLSLQFGMDGILYGLIASFALTVLWGVPLAYYRITKKMQSREFTVLENSVP